MFLFLYLLGVLNIQTINQLISIVITVRQCFSMAAVSFLLTITTTILHRYIHYVITQSSNKLVILGLRFQSLRHQCLWFNLHFIIRSIFKRILNPKNIWGYILLYISSVALVIHPNLVKYFPKDSSQYHT